MPQILIGNVKGPQGAQGVQGPQGEQGDAATISVGSTTTVPYGQTASVTNSGTEHDAVFDFVIPQGRPGEETTVLDELVLDTITEPSTNFPVLAIGDVGKVLFGKIKKWCSDMADLVADKLDKTSVVNNLTTTAPGLALDARQGKALSDALSPIGTVYSQSAVVSSDADLSMPAGDLIFTVPAGTYIITFGGISRDSEKVIQANVNGGNPWQPGYLSTYVPWNSAGTMFSMYKSYPLTVSESTQLTMHYTDYWYHTEFSAVRIK